MNITYIIIIKDNKGIFTKITNFLRALDVDVYVESEAMYEDE